MDTVDDLLTRGWPLVPIAAETKRPYHEAWNNPERSFSHSDWRSTDLVGLRLGIGPRRIHDIDNDSPEAIAVAPFNLPPTDAVFGRPGAEASHYLYEVDESEPLPRGFELKNHQITNARLVEFAARANRRSSRRLRTSAARAHGPMAPSVHPIPRGSVCGRRGKRIAGTR